mgnify:CR=1 FL=1
MVHQTENIKEDILTRLIRRELKPGDAVDVGELKDRFSVSSTPIREALLMLEALGIVERRRRGGPIVRVLDYETLTKLVEVVAELEGTSAALASSRINSEQATALVEAAQECLDFANSGQDPTQKYYHLNLKFHLAVGAASGNEKIIEQLFKIGQQLYPYLAIRNELPGQPLISANEHLEIAGAILDADADRARELMIRHDLFSNRDGLAVLHAIRDSD